MPFQPGIAPKGFKALRRKRFIEKFNDIGKLQRMPIYEFHCEDCKKDSEILVRSTNWKGTQCPGCGSTRLEKKLSVFASTTGADDNGPSCSGNPGSCGRCGTGVPHSH